MPQTPLEIEIRRHIERSGPMPVREFMAWCLTHPQHGYYMTRDPLGARGDFTTSPEISQVFGELIGIWTLAVWSQMGRPRPFRLVELGPGRGTMILDALRAARVMPEFRSAIALHLVEVSPTLRQHQQQALRAIDLPVAWHDSIDDIPDGPSITLANEFFDALPINQSLKQPTGWHERVIDIDEKGKFAFRTSSASIAPSNLIVPRELDDAPIGSIYEWRNTDLIVRLSKRVIQQGGAALIIDYGHTQSCIGETLQAMTKHTFAEPLLVPGQVDLTAHVDFAAAARAAESAGACVHGPVEQAHFLKFLSIEKRIAKLKALASPEQATALDIACDRLLNEGQTGMGRLFKVLAIANPRLGGLPGFEL